MMSQDLDLDTKTNIPKINYTQSLESTLANKSGIVKRPSSSNDDTISISEVNALTSS